MALPALNEWFYENLFNNAAFSVAVVDRDYRIVAANAEFERHYGPWESHKCFEVYKGRADLCPGCQASLAFSDGMQRVSEETGADSDGNPRFYLVNFLPQRSPGGEISYVIEISIDLTQRVMIEREYRQIFDHSPCYITVLDRAFRVLKANHRFLEKFGGREGAYCHELFKKQKGRCADCPSMKVFDSGEVHESLQTGLDKDGRTTHYLLTAAPLLRDAGGRVLRVTEIALDISEMLSLKDRLKQVEQEKLEAERLAVVGQTVAGLAHGIKNVVMGLEGGLYVVHSGLRRDDGRLVESGWEMLNNNIQRMSAFVREFLNFAKGTRPEVQWAEPLSIAERAVEEHRKAAKQAGITIETDLRGPIDKAPMDAEGIQMSISRLISNAIDACLASDRRYHNIQVRCHEEDGTIYYTVEDNGCGMDYEVKNKVFTSFFTTKSSGQGTGLGLLTVRKVVHQHGGRVSFNSTAGKGSTFTLAFPRERLPRIPDARDDEMVPGHGGGAESWEER
ncbi:MAG: PAS domain-containing sensor histidine kinase [Acidobacteriota bacterium]